MTNDAGDKLPELIPIHRLPDLIPSSRRGKKLALATIYRWCQQGRIPTLKVGGGRYVTATALAELLNSDSRAAPVSEGASAAGAAFDAGVLLDRLLSKSGRTARSTLRITRE